MLLLLIPAVIIGVFVGITFGWQWVFAPLLGWALMTWLIASLRVLVTDGKGRGDAEGGPTPISGDERTLFWCEECGTEVMLLVRGTPRAPSHCGQRMHERTELLNEVD
jgi:hypothetical protein